VNTTIPWKSRFNFKSHPYTKRALNVQIYGMQNLMLKKKT
jgi:hypothetical protein